MFFEKIRKNADKTKNALLLSAAFWGGGGSVATAQKKTAKKVYVKRKMPIFWVVF